MKTSSVNGDVLFCRCAIYVEERCDEGKEKLWTQRRHVSTVNMADGDGDDVQLDDKAHNTAALQNVAESPDCYNNDDDESRDANHSDVARDPADSDDVQLATCAERNPPYGCRIKKSVSFRGATTKCPDGNAEGDKHVLHSLTRPRQRNNQQQQHNQPPPKVTSCQTSRNTTGSDRDLLSVKAALRDRNEKQDSGSRRSQSKGPDKRSTYASGLTTQRDTEELASTCSWSRMERRVDDKQPCLAADRHKRRSTSINWFVDLTDSANTELRPPTSLANNSVDRLRQHQGIDDGNNLEPESFRRTTSRDNSGRRGRATTRATLDQLRHHDVAETTNTSASKSAPVELGEKFTPLRRTWSSKANRMSELRTSKSPDREDVVFQRPSVSPFRRSIVVTRPKCAETSIPAGGAVQPAERGSTRTRSLSLSEQYRRLIGGDWLDNFATSSAVANQQQQTPVNGLHCKPFAVSRELKPDFVIYV